MPALDQYRKGAAMERCQLPYHKSEILAGMLLPTLGKTRDACRLLAAEARRFEARQEFTKAVDNYLAVVRIGEHHGAGRCLIDHLVGIASISIGLDNAFDGMCRNDYPAEDLKRFLKRLEPLRERLPDFAHAMRSEKAFGLGTFDDQMRLVPAVFEAHARRKLDEPFEPSPLLARTLRIIFPDRTMKADMAAYYDRAIANAKIPLYAEGHLDQEELMRECKPWNVLAGLLLPALGRARIEAEKCRARFEMTRIAVGLRLYHRKDGVYPDTLDWLVQEKHLERLPVDPLSGKPFKYKVKKGQFVLYSVGKNMKDDGGKLEEPTDFVGPDIGFTSKLPPAKPYRDAHKTRE
jgi:hypothetical protein